MKKMNHTQKRRLIAAVISVITILAVSGLAAGCSWRTKTLRLGTAGIGGNYYSFGKTFSEFLMEDMPDTEVDVRVTTGSGANLRMITKNKPEIELAIMQADVIAELENKNAESVQKSADDPKAKDSKYETSGFGAIAGMYSEAVQIVVREDSGIKSVNDLAGKAIGVGEAESGTERNARMVLDAYGITSGLYAPKNLSYSKAAEALEEKEIAAFFCTMGTPSSSIRSLANKLPIRLLEISGEGAETIKKEVPYFVSHTIPAGTYKGQDKDVQTIGVKSVLTASDNLSEKMVKKITQCLFDHASELRYSVTVNYQPDPEEAVKGLPVPLHEGAKAWYEENGIQ